MLKSFLQPIPCKLNCTAFNSYQKKNPTPKPAPTEGFMQTANNCSKNTLYYVSNVTATRNEAALRCKAMNMTLLSVPSLEALDCVSSLNGSSTYWTSGSSEDLNCDLEKQYAWCSTGENISSELISSSKFWLPTTTAPSTQERCLAFVNSGGSGMVHKNCNDSLQYICVYTVDCPNLCTKNDSLFDSAGNLINKSSYGVWINTGNYTYLLGNKPMTWLNNHKQCCALGMEALNIENAFEQLGLTNLTISFKDNWKANFNYWTSGTRKGSPLIRWAWCKSAGPALFTQDLTWERGQPDNKGGNETCTHFRFNFNTSKTILTDRNCSNLLIFACEREIITTPPPLCIATCPTSNCTRNATLFDSTGTELNDFFSYGNWYDGCGRSILTYTKTPSNWSTARDNCCKIGLTLASMETAGKLSCFSKIVSKFSPATLGDFWISGTDLGCDSNFRWCSLNRGFVDAELKWKPGHPQIGLHCVYLEVRNESVLLVTANCTEEKDFLCEMRKKNTIQRAMQVECAETWDITPEQIEMLLEASQFITANISINLKCFLKCIGVEVGLV
ncbi:Hypothetical predicted protein [Cloeon dipterum]|uniref:C-type lectin domain-containing protein n=1 Tax=Cloeon dipterum TaxID=197152 RepID=A0A8S1CQE5_9INSE|nr:Hypothetical predicted protein [Cloeon dipterum]